MRLGTVRNKLTLIEEIKRSGKITHFRCMCECGKETVIRRNKFGITKSCGCLLHRKGEDSPLYTGCGSISGRYWEAVRRNANNRNLIFEITAEDGWRQFCHQNGRCAYTGRVLRFSHQIQQKRSEGTASLDRVDNSNGYTIENIHWVHKRINQIKMDMSQNEFISWCEEVTRHAR